MERERGSTARVQIMGGMHDGAVGRVVRVFDRADGERVQVVELADGTVVEIASRPAPETMPRERGTD